MHVANVRLLITALENSADEHFDMSNVYSVDGCATDGESGFKRPKREDCGTAACIAGWCGWLAVKEARAQPRTLVATFYGQFCHRSFGRDIWQGASARVWLSIKTEAAEALFMPQGWATAPHLYPRARAIDVLKDMLKTYEDTGIERVRWDAFPYNNYAPKPTPVAAPEPAAVEAPPAPSKPLPVELTRLTQEA